MLGDARYEKTLQIWRCVLLGSKLVEDSKTMRSNFKLEDLGFVQHFDADVGSLPVNFRQDDAPIKQTSTGPQVRAGSYEGSQGHSPVPPKPEASGRADIDGKI